MPPVLILFSGDWSTYERELDEIFMAEIARGGIVFRGWRVNCRRIPESGGRWASFWHLIQEGPMEDERIPDIRRCERIRWIRWVIENADEHPEICAWENTRGSEDNVLLWYREEYLVILSRRTGHWLLKTAFCTENRGKIVKLRQERDAFHAPEADQKK